MILKLIWKNNGRKIFEKLAAFENLKFMISVDFATSNESVGFCMKKLNFSGYDCFKMELTIKSAKIRKPQSRKIRGK